MAIPFNIQVNKGLATHNLTRPKGVDYDAKIVVGNDSPYSDEFCL